MSGIQYQLKKRLFRLKAYRRKGFKGHSSEAIDLITNVIGAKLHFYAFGQLQQTRELAINLLKSSCKSSAISSERANALKEEILNLKRGKSTDRMIFRLMNFYRVKKPLFIGNGLAYTKAYMAKVDSRLTISCIGDCLKNEEINFKIFKEQLKVDNIRSVEFRDLNEIDFVVISNLNSEENLELFVSNYCKYLTKHCVLIFLNMNKNSKLLACWKKLKRDSMFGLNLNMTSIGILMTQGEKLKKIM
ncbi:MAG: hypothetical protein N4A59_07105 [Marinifilum sp.]|jgi:hypothetical protein|nr:hypothetical protein [Marinifilum sp.]